MIVQCTSCRARFRVADEKVPDKGVKVRCTKCANVFKVTRADAVDAPGRGADAFGLDGPSPGPTTGRNTRSFELGEPTPTPGAGPTPGPRVVPNLPRGASLTYGASTPGQVLDFDLGLGGPQLPAPPPMPPLSVAPPARSPAPARPPPARTTPPQRPAPQPAPPPPGLDFALDAALSSADPFADLDLGAAPPLPPPPRPAPPPARAFAPPPAPAMDPFAVSRSADPFADGDFGVGPSAPAPAPAPAPIAGGQDDPFALSFGGDPPPWNAPRAPAPPPPARAAAAPAPPSLGDEDPFALSFDASPGEPAAATAPAAPKGEALSPPELSDPFAGLDPSPGAPAPPPRSTDSDRGEFDFSDFGGGGSRLDLELGGGGGAEQREAPVEVARIPLAKAEEQQNPAKDPVDVRASARQRVRREVASALFNVASAGIVALAGLVAVALLRSPRPLTAEDFGFPMVWIALGFDGAAPAEQLLATRVRTGTYVTRSGAELFYVQGFAENTSSAQREAVHVAVELLNGDRILGRVESVASLDAGAEQLFELTTRRNEDLQRSLAQGRDPASLRLAPRARAPFLAVFPLGSDEVDGSSVRLTVLDGVPPTLRSAFKPATPVEREPDPTPTAAGSE